MLFIVLFSGNVMAQKPAELMIKGREYFQMGDFYSAEMYFAEALKKDSMQLDWWYQYASAAQKNYSFSNAINAYSRVWKKDNGKKYPDALFQQAACLQWQGRYKEAMKLHEKNKRKFQKKNPELASKSEKAIEACSLALELIANPMQCTVVKLDTNINSSASDFAAFEHDSVLYFSSLRDNFSEPDNSPRGRNRIMFKKLGAPKKEKAQLLAASINKEDSHNANLSATQDGKVWYFTRCNELKGKYICKIFQAEKLGDEFVNVVELPESINKKGSTNTHPFPGRVGDMDYLFFSSDRSGGMGGMDIWFCMKNAYGEWSEPVNAGVEVNTEDDEVSPYFCSPCKLLFFSSQGLPGLGGFDVFRSQLGNNQFQKPENMGVPINSSYNDVYFSMNKARSRAYVSSNRPDPKKGGSESCCNDIFRFDLPKSSHSEEPEILEKPDTVKILTKRLNTLIPLTLYFNNDEPDKKTLATSTKKTYSESFESYLADRKNYVRQYSAGLKSDRKEEAIQEIEDFFEDSVIIGYRDLQKFTATLKELLSRGATVTITLKGYCSPLASTQYNINLAKRRISSLVNYFKAFDNGALIPFIDNTSNSGGKIAFVEEEVGELKASPLVSDNPNDKSGSVYSRMAALERKIQIIAVSAE
jgi:hypothetical protein